MIELLLWIFAQKKNKNSIFYAFICGRDVLLVSTVA
jgi:hypothetical protein